MSLLEAYRFLLVKKRIPDIVNNMQDKTISSINRFLRKCLIGRGVDSIHATVKSSNTVMIKMGLKNMKISFLFPFTQERAQFHGLHPTLRALIEELEARHVTTEEDSSSV